MPTGHEVPDYFGGLDISHSRIAATNYVNPYPNPLRCDVCGVREVKAVTVEKPMFKTDVHWVWYVTVADPLPAGWVTLEDPTYHYSETLCLSCFADSREEPIDE